MADVQEANIEIAGQKVNLKSVALNTLLTILTFVGVVLVGYMVYTHVGEAKEAGKELAQALKESTSAAREQNCLISFEQNERQKRADFCKQIAR